MNQLSVHKSISSLEIPCCVRSIIHLFHHWQQEMLFRENTQAQILSVVYFPHTPSALTLSGKRMFKFPLVAVHGLFHSLLQRQCQKFSTACVKQFFLSCVLKRSSTGFSECRVVPVLWDEVSNCSSVTLPTTSLRWPPSHVPPSAFSSARKDPAFLVPPQKAASPIPRLFWLPSSPLPLTL